MPIVKTIPGNLLKMFQNDEFDMIVHGCNCFHTMGAGIAGQISKRFPEALDMDIACSKNGDRSKLGSYTFAWTSFGMIVNGYTQFYPGRENELRLNMSVGQVFARLNDDVSGHFPNIKDVRVGIPKIGAGIAGGRWGLLESIINGVSDNLHITVVDYDGS